MTLHVILKNAMSYLLRKISRKKWDQNVKATAEEITADAVTCCIKTFSNTLSVWHSPVDDFDSKQVRILIYALASTMDRPDAIDLVWLSEDELLSLGIEIEETDGDSKCESANLLHRDLAKLRHKELGLVGVHIIEQLEHKKYYKRITRAQIIKVMLEAVCVENKVEFTELSEKWQHELLKKMSSEDASFYSSFVAA